MEPTLLWQHFHTFCDTPRPSGSEDALAAKIEAWADTRGFEHERDAAGNLLLRKPASPGHENSPGVVLQGHLDMVAETASDVIHDFHQDPIETVIDDGWLYAVGTTLGADNGVGAAAALAILDDDALTHGPLEALMTVQEEVGLIGAGELVPGWLHGRLLLNLDTEEEGEVGIGCAGGTNVGIDHQFAAAPIDNASAVLRVGVHGLVGGHSGGDIHTGRASANRLLGRVLDGLCPHGLRLVDYDGGRMDNAITRAAAATVAIDASAVDTLAATLAEQQRTFRDELAGVDEAVTMSFAPAAAEQALGADDSARVVALLNALPFGVERMSVAAPGVVETSNNIGVVQLADERLQAQFMVRSLRVSARDALAARVAAVVRLAGFEPIVGRSYPGWTPEPDSPLLARFQRVHERVTGDRAQLPSRPRGLGMRTDRRPVPGYADDLFRPDDPRRALARRARASASGRKLLSSAAGNGRGSGGRLSLVKEEKISRQGGKIKKVFWLHVASWRLGVRRLLSVRQSAARQQNLLDIKIPATCEKHMITSVSVAVHTTTRNQRL